jgi:polyisoprenoid-binding protein YceI
MKTVHIVVIAAAGLLTSSVARAERFEIRTGDKHSQVTFESKAPMETFEGKTRKVSGFVEFDPAALADSVTVLAEVDLASLDTGIPIRNKHMRENHLETSKYPKAVFRGGRVSEVTGSTLRPGESSTFVLSGTFALHGVTREIAVPVEAAREKDGSLHVVARFPVNLSDYAISRPEFLVLKLDQTQKVTVDVRAAAP